MQVTVAVSYTHLDNNGMLKESIDANELIFSGSFSGLGVNAITIDRAVNLKGTNSAALNLSLIHI